ncbi:MAG: class I SAM-dependent methyltransferase [candidate division Zixibacteria bacterium]|nr:class I SAM-dependent methyltransferase [candidate division Zixibacteria bacterium]
MLTDRIKHYRTDAEEFDYFNVENPVHANEEKRRMQFLERLIKFAPGNYVIDCGSGNGWLAREYLQQGIVIISVDISDKNLRRIKNDYDSQNKGFYIAADLNQLPFKEGVFDGAVSNDVYEHIEEPKTAAAEVWRCLKKGAKFYVSVPYNENIVYYLCIHCNKPTPINAHLHSFNEESLGAIFTEAGFKIVNTYKIINKLLSATFVYYALCRWMPYWLWRTIDITVNLFAKKQSRLALKMVRS